jgi:hypothetical protein
MFEVLTRLLITANVQEYVIMSRIRVTIRGQYHLEIYKTINTLRRNSMAELVTWFTTDI